MTTRLMFSAGALALASTPFLGCGDNAPNIADGGPRDGAVADMAEPLADGPSVDRASGDAAPLNASAMIGPNGGELVVAGMKMTIPAGALSGMTELKVERPEDQAALPAVKVSNLYEFGPLGTMFTQPVTVALDLLRTPAAGEEVVLIWSRPDGDIDELPARLMDGKAVGNVSHFSLGVAAIKEPSSLCSAVVNCGMRCQCENAMGDSLYVDGVQEANAFVAEGNGFACMGTPFTGTMKMAGTTAKCEPAESEPFLCQIKFFKARHEEAWKHAKDALEERDSRQYVIVDRPGARARRAANIKAYKEDNPDYSSMNQTLELDEFPPAMTDAVTVPASVRPINARHNESAGSCFRHQAAKIPNGRKILIVLDPPQ